MRIFLHSAYDTHTGLDILLKYAPLDSVGRHSLCTDAEEADAIVFIENTQFDDLLFKRLQKHPLVLGHPDKVFMYNEMDRPWDLLPGLYSSMPKKHINADRHRAFAYLYTPNEFIQSVHEKSDDTPWLYSFMGSMSHSCRHQIMRLKNDAGYLKDTSEFNVWDTDPEEMKRRGQEYADVLAASKFVLCPRGIGSSSIRLYETLEAGRVPVIISDDWVPPVETDWSFALQVEERRIASIPGLLNSMINEASERGQTARKAWEQSYAPNTLFNTMGNSIESIMEGDAHTDSSKQIINLQKWITTGELLTRSAAQKIRRG